MVVLKSRWFRQSTPVAVDGNGRWQVGGSLVIGITQVTDSGEYRCEVNNSGGTITISTILTITSPLSVQVS